MSSKGAGAPTGAPRSTSGVNTVATYANMHNETRHTDNSQETPRDAKRAHGGVFFSLSLCDKTHTRASARHETKARLVMRDKQHG